MQWVLTGRARERSNGSARTGALRRITMEGIGFLGGRTRSGAGIVTCLLGGMGIMVIGITGIRRRRRVRVLVRRRRWVRVRVRAQGRRRLALLRRVDAPTQSRTLRTPYQRPPPPPPQPRTLLEPGSDTPRASRTTFSAAFPTLPAIPIPTPVPLPVPVWVRVRVVWVWI